MSGLFAARATHDVGPLNSVCTQFLVPPACHGNGIPPAPVVSATSRWRTRMYRPRVVLYVPAAVSSLMTFVLPGPQYPPLSTAARPTDIGAIASASDLISVGSCSCIAPTP